MRQSPVDALAWSVWFCSLLLGESIPIRLFLSGYDLTPTMCDINKKFSVRYYLNLVLLDEDDRRYFKQHVTYNFVLLSVLWLWTQCRPSELGNRPYPFPG